ncbi:nucleoside hydrolase [Tianweitania sp. BSSL-BM11]|uniref:Nucleoside hydrolase n=1 Tax=Tianweitania aestuarii TaxID=2814886 RepID=A0ABS5RV78_9HYPH|nr:nucleoside hydrolase [Tianweitania aestuarii]MBS9720227.1 nucleoside hydrolase [Tianweitania aestuarii]
MEDASNSRLVAGCPVWIDTDMGFDDLAAILIVAASRPVAGLSLVAGNVALHQVERNALAVASMFKWDFPIHAGAAAPLKGHLETAHYVLGADGMPGTGRKLPAVEGHAQPDALGAMIGFIEKGGRDILAIGPLTDLAHLAEARPDLLTLPDLRLVWMGGSAGPGNHTAAAEFNAAVDPEALAVLIAAGVQIAMVGLDCCRQVTLTLDDVAPLRAHPSERAQLLADLLEGYVRIADNGHRPMALYDPVAAAAVIEPDSVTFTPARLDIELDGTLTRGMTVIEWRARKAAPNALIATTADAPRIRAMMQAALLRAAGDQDQ